MPVAPVRISGVNGTDAIETYAVLDSAATDSLCSAELVEMLGIDGDEVQSTIITATGAKETEVTKWVSLVVMGYHHVGPYAMRALALRNFTDLSRHIPSPRDIDRYTHLRGLSIPSHSRKKVDLLIGIGESPLHFSYEQRKGKPAQLWATLSGIGWVLHGRDQGIDNQSLSDATVHTVRLSGGKDPSQADDELLTLVRRQCALDFDEPQHGRSRDLSRREKEMLARQQSTVKVVNNRYEIGLLWRFPPSTLPNNYSMAYRCLKNLGRRLQGDSDLLEKYRLFISAMIEKGQAEIAPAPLAQAPDSVWFLIHHPVLKKFRVVFNGRAGFQGQSLNNCLDKGPDHTSTLLGTLLRFRLHRFAATADIKGMFYNVSLPEEERNFLRFLWWEDGDPKRAIIEHRLTHQAPGLTSSGSNACFIIRKVSEDNLTRAGRETVESLRNHFYMDDWLPSYPTLRQLKQVINEIRVALSAAGFRLTKFLTNAQSVLKDVPLEDLAPAGTKAEPGAPSENKVLGICWDPRTDKLHIETSVQLKPATRRGTLSTLMSPFDPCGMMVPFLLDMKLLLQRLFQADLGWDTPIPENERKLWAEWLEQLPALAGISCPRALIPRPDYLRVYLCTFADASEKGYAAVSYVVCDYGFERSVSFALGKVRVPPSKRQLTIPRLELLAAVLAAELATTIQEELPITFSQTYYWTDSITVMHYVRNRDLRLKSFVANRVSKIHELTAQGTWSHVRTHENAADVGTRGLSPRDSSRIKLWLEGPSFLRLPPNEWPLSSADDEVLPAPAALEIKSNILASTVVAEPVVSPLSPLFARYSSLFPLQRSTAWLLRARTWLKTGKQGPGTPFLKVREMDDALLALVRAAQWEVYPVLISGLRSNIQKSSRRSTENEERSQWTALNQLNPYLDEAGLLRVGGRLQNAGLSYSQTHPLILPRRHLLTGLLVHSCHEQNAHLGFGFVLAQLRERYWVIGGTATVRHYLAKCIACRHFRAASGVQQMAPLPACRFQIGVPAFSYCAVDYFGPLKVMVRRRPEKRWGCLMTCLTTRAVHLEVAHALSADSFLLAFRRFLSHYPTVKEMLSDNGTNFHGADEELKAGFRAIDLAEIAKGLQPKGVDFRWRFNPPAASHQGGVFERLIGLVRACLRRVMADASYRTPTDEILLTMLSEIAGIVNSRPLLPGGHDPDKFDILTPAQILRPGTPAVPQPVREFTRSAAIRNGFKSSQWHTQAFWKHFIADYIPLLQKRPRGLQIEKNFAVGDLVLIKDKDAPRYTWKRGRVIAVYRNSVDGLVRRVRLRLANRTERDRDIRYICHLEAAPLGGDSEVEATAN